MSNFNTPPFKKFTLATVTVTRLASTLRCSARTTQNKASTLDRCRLHDKSKNQDTCSLSARGRNVSFPLPPSTPKQYTFVAVLRMERMLRFCKALINPSSNAAVSADKLMSARSALQTYATCPDGFEARKISLGAAVFSGFCKYCASSCFLDVLQSLNFPNDYQFFCMLFKTQLCSWINQFRVAWVVCSAGIKFKSFEFELLPQTIVSYTPQYRFLTQSNY